MTVFWNYNGIVVGIKSVFAYVYCDSKEYEKKCVNGGYMI